jgi:hypothetical protein
MRSCAIGISFCRQFEGTISMKWPGSILCFYQNSTGQWMEFFLNVFLGGLSGFRFKAMAAWAPWLFPLYPGRKEH